MHDEFCNKAEAFDAFDDIPTNPHLENTIGDLINRRFGRRDVLRDANGKWAPVLDSKYNRRISALQTAMTLDGPAAGNDRMKTTEDPAGQQVIGTINNCAGGITPWGTYLMAEENFHGYFWTDKKNEAGKPVLEGPEAKSWKRYGVPGGGYAWGKYFDRFNVDKEPNESNRFGWVVEVDPLAPDSTPVKHTALGRFRHEGAKSITNTDGRVVIYMGDDNSFDYLYKFVSDGKVSHDRTANLKLLSQGTLYVAKFNEDSTVDWMPLVHGQGPLTAANGFHSQADVLIDTRLAADLLEATPMDRPEDVQPGLNGSVYFMLTNNTQRKPGQENAANPRAASAFGHIIEIVEPNRNYAATQSKWDILVLCGDPKVAEVGAKWNPATSEHGWFGSPDNCTIDADGRLWVSTDQGSAWPKTGKADGLYGLETQGAGRGTSKLFFRAPVGAELCSPCFTADNQTLFLSVQHPATDGVKSYPGFESDSTFEKPATRWPDFKAGMPPRPSVVVITKKGGGKIA